MKKENIKKFKNSNIGFYLVVVVIIFLLHPKLMLMHKNMSIFINIFLWTGVATVYFSNRFLSSIEKSKEGIDLLDFFSPIGRKEVAKYPERYFSDDDYKTYKVNLKLMTIAFLLMMVTITVCSIIVMR